MRQNIVVLTYPAHFYLTKACINSIKKQFSGHKTITVLIDDTSALSWDSYIDDCRTLYTDTTVNVRPISQLIELTPVNEKNYIPWVKQQLIKLHLDLIFPYEEIFLTDGDVIFENEIPYNSVPYVKNSVYQGYSGLDYYTSCLLHICSNGIKARVGHHISRADTAAVPFRDVKLAMLSDLRQYVENITEKNFLDLHTEMSDIDINYISEWELMEVYKSQILKQSLNLIEVHITDLMDNKIWPQHQYSFSTLWTHEKALGKTFWDEQQIQIDQTIWDNLPDSKY